MKPGDRILSIGGAAVARIIRTPRGAWVVAKLYKPWATEFRVRKTTLRDKYGVQWKLKE